MITNDIVRKAIMGTQIRTNAELLASSEGRIPNGFISAIEIVVKRPSEFRQLTLNNLQGMPLFSQYFGQLIKTRLNQQDYLSSPLIAAVFDEDKPIEKRLERIVGANVKGLESIEREYRHTSKELDKIARDLLAEILVLDFLVQLGFTNIKRPFSKNMAHVDVLAEKKGKFYSIEITRKQKVEKWETISFGNIEDCRSQNNLRKMCSVLKNTLEDKNDQFLRAIESGTVEATTVKVVSIKTSDYGFAECSEQADEIVKELLSTDKYRLIDCVWLVPNIEPSNSKWTCRNHRLTRTLTPICRKHHESMGV